MRLNLNLFCQQSLSSAVSAKTSAQISPHGLFSHRQSPGLQSPGLQSPGLQSPGLQSPGLQSPGLQSPGLQSPGLQSPGLTLGVSYISSTGRFHGGAVFSLAFYDLFYSFLRSQGEKEALYNDSRTKIDEIQQRKEEELKSLNIRIQKLQGDLLSANQSVGEMKEQLQSRQKEHELVLHTLRDQIQTVKTQEMNLLRDQNTALNVELQQRRTEQESFLAQRDDLNSQLQEGNRANSRLLEQLTVLDQWKDRLQQELEEAKKTADKRKVMLDELAMEIITEKSRHKEELSDVRLQHEKEVLGVRARYEKELRGLHEDKNRTEEGIRSQLRDEKARNKELEGLQQCVEELQAQVQSMEDTKGWFERRLKDAEVHDQLHFHIDLFTRIFQYLLEYVV
ncbi:unnamed protein product [Oncorhynchus mykiss]|uniref:Uncharacterized protein n=1 Tax=Oncorhynchus mykiss TaxID=8022 RepID=A0A060XVX8_ONCMY|nr:unnamed protein product [Oncorhynchus mykiss]